MWSDQDQSIHLTQAGAHVKVTIDSMYPVPLTGELDLTWTQVHPQCVLLAITLVEGVARDGGSRSRAGCETGIPFCSVAFLALPAARGEV